MTSLESKLSALGLTSAPKEGYVSIDTSIPLWGNQCFLFKHEKDKATWYTDRFECIKAMKRAKSKRFAGYNGEWVLLEMYEYEKELLRKEMLIDINKKRYGIFT